ncbi:MAG: hypothetical protein KAX44_03615 [Candidatus Brocadiae bacterium]|nr:hypothetical protein [Candidatus Brocadiia bacterium]
MSKGDVIRRKRALEKEQESARLNAATEAAMARMREAAQAAPFFCFRPNCAYANRSWITRTFSHLPGAWPNGVSWRQLELPGPPGGIVEVCNMTDVEELFDSGRLGAEWMGVLEIFTLTDFAALNFWERDMLGVDHARRDMELVTGLTNRFNRAGLDLIGKARNWPPGESPPPWDTWTCVDDDPALGRHETLEMCLPLEVGFMHRHPRILWVRGLSHISHRVKQTELGRARNRLECARRSVGDSPGGRGYLGELEGEVRVLEAELQGSGTTVMG